MESLLKFWGEQSNFTKSDCKVDIAETIPGNNLSGIGSDLGQAKTGAGVVEAGSGVAKTIAETTKPGWLARLFQLWNWVVRSDFDRGPRMSKITMLKPRCCNRWSAPRAHRPAPRAAVT